MCCFRPFWINYKHLKKKINEIVILRKADKDGATDASVQNIAKLEYEIEFFKEIKAELKECSNFFSSIETEYTNRFERIAIGYNQLKLNFSKYDKNSAPRLLQACINLYKDVLQLENFAVTNYCGYSKILKKHDKMTGFATRDAFMRNVMSVQNFTQYPVLLNLIKKSEELYANIQTVFTINKNEIVSITTVTMGPGSTT